MTATPEVLREYRLLRRPHVSPRYGLGSDQPTAGACLEYAKRRVWVRHNWNEPDNDGVAYSNDGQWRLRVVPDEFCTLDDLAGDMFNPKAVGNVPGGLRTIQAERKEWERNVERNGVWGYVLERRLPPCPTCGRAERWEHVDSCFGFDCGVHDEALIDAQFQAKGGV